MGDGDGKGARASCLVSFLFLFHRDNKRERRLDAWSRVLYEAVQVAIARRGYREVQADGFTEDVEKARSKL